MFGDVDLSALGLDLPEDKVAALKEALSAKAKEHLEAEERGAKAQSAGLQAKLTAAQAELDSLKGQFDGFDMDALKGLLQKASQDEETKLIAEGKIDLVIDRRTERFRSEVDKQIKAEQEEREKAQARAQSLEARALSDAIRSAALEAGAEKTALEDFVFRSRGIWALDEQGNPVALENGEVVYGKDGKTKLTTKEWAESLRETAAHLFPRAQGSGAMGGNRYGGAPQSLAECKTDDERVAYLKTIS